jgi:hypothetical protein
VVERLKVTMARQSAVLEKLAHLPTQARQAVELSS